MTFLDERLLENWLLGLDLLLLSGVRGVHISLLGQPLPPFDLIVQPELLCLLFDHFTLEMIK